MNFIIEGSATVEFTGKDENAEYYRIKTEGGDVKVSFAEPMYDLYGIWNPTSGTYKRMPQWFARQITESRFCFGSPLLAAFDSHGNAGTVVSLSEFVKDTKLFFYVDDFHQKNEVFFGAELPGTERGFETTLRIDRSRRPLCTALHEASSVWSIHKAIPEKAFAPLYSSWYNFHQDPEQKALTEELREASSLGFETVIIDDGWQIEGSGTSDYIKSGDWKVAEDKFPDFAGFVSDVHSFGMKVLLWFSVPFVGYKTKAYERFSDKLLCRIDYPINAGVLDVRYPDVRRFLVGIYTDFIHKYDIDGLKLDFIDTFRQSPESPVKNDDMDSDTVDEAVIKLLEEIKTETEAIKPDFLSEFRQNYIGPAILKYGNMLRVGDCAYDSLTNRVGVIDLRMGCDDIAIHSDMLYWSPDEKIGNCALQLLNIMFSVPQISVRLSESTDEQKKLLRYFIDYVKENSNTLLHSPLTVRHPEANYSSVTAEGKDMKISVLYSDTLYFCSGCSEDIWNAAGEKCICVIPEFFSGDVTVYDCLGNIADSPVSGNIYIPFGGHLSVKAR